MRQLDGIPDWFVLLVNCAFAAFVMLAHGGALVISRAQESPDARSVEELARWSLPIAGLCLVAGLVALLRPSVRGPVLGGHGLAFASGALALLGWAVAILVNGIPDGNFSWGAGFLSLTVGWAFYVFRRFTLPERIREYAVGYYLHLLALLAALPVDLGVGFLMLRRVSETFQRM